MSKKIAKKNTKKTVAKKAAPASKLAGLTPADGRSGPRTPESRMSAQVKPLNRLQTIFDSIATQAEKKGNKRAAKKAASLSAKLGALALYVG